MTIAEAPPTRPLASSEGMVPLEDWAATDVHKASTYACGKCGQTFDHPHEIYEHLDAEHLDGESTEETDALLGPGEALHWATSMNVPQNADETRSASRSWLVVVSESGYGKKTATNAIPRQGRDRQGVRILGSRAGTAAGAVVAGEGSTILIHTLRRVVRLAVADLPEKGREAKGSRVVTLREGDSVVGVERVPGRGA